MSGDGDFYLGLPARLFPPSIVAGARAGDLVSRVMALRIRRALIFRFPDIPLTPEQLMAKPTTFRWDRRRNTVHLINEDTGRVIATIRHDGDLFHPYWGDESLGIYVSERYAADALGRAMPPDITQGITNPL